MTVAIGGATGGARELIACARRAFVQAMSVAHVGSRVNDIGRVVPREVWRSGFSVVRGLDGHGIGRTIHEEPRVPNVYDPLARRKLTRGRGPCRPLRADDRRDGRRPDRRDRRVRHPGSAALW